MSAYQMLCGHKRTRTSFPKSEHPPKITVNNGILKTQFCPFTKARVYLFRNRLRSLMVHTGDPFSNITNWARYGIVVTRVCKNPEQNESPFCPSSKNLGKANRRRVPANAKTKGNKASPKPTAGEITRTPARASNAIPTTTKQERIPHCGPYMNWRGASIPHSPLTSGLNGPCCPLNAG